MQGAGRQAGRRAASPLVRPVPTLVCRPLLCVQVGVATDTARRFRSELAMSKYKDIDKMYDDLRP